MAYDYEYFKKAVLDLTKIDLDAYKEKQMKRRIDTLITKNKITGYDNCFGVLSKSGTVADYGQRNHSGLNQKIREKPENLERGLLDRGRALFSCYGIIEASSAEPD